MVTAKQIYDYIDGIAPFDTAMSFDNVGILTGSQDTETSLVLVALDATAAVIEEAAQKGAGIIVTHHPVIFHPLRTLSWDNPAYLAAKHGITIISAHTNLDISRNGVNATLSHRVGLQEEKRFEEHCAILGTVSGYDSAEDYALYIKECATPTGAAASVCWYPAVPEAITWSLRLLWEPTPSLPERSSTATLCMQTTTIFP